MIFLAKLRGRLASMSSVEYLPERVSMLYRLSGTDVPIILVAASITAFAMWGYIGVNLIAMWFIWLGIASMVRYAMARIYRRRQPAADDAAQWENYFCLASALVGAGWGLALMLIGHTPASLQELTVTFLISSVAMGLPPSLAPSPKAFTSFILPILAPMVAMLLTFGGGLNTSTALLMLVFATVLLGLYLSNHYALIETLAYGHENTLLLQKLRVAEKSLTAALAEQQLIFDTAAVGIAFVSQGAVVKCNRRFAELLGYAVDEIVGQSTRVWLQSDEDLTQPGSRAYALLAQGEHYSAELLLRKKDGTPIWVFTDSRAIDAVKPQDGIIIGIGDITERKLAEAALQQTKERLDLAMQSSAISIWEWDAKRGTLYLDAALAQMTGEEPRERYLTLDEMATLVHPDDVDAVRQAQTDCITGLRRRRVAHGRDQRRHHPAQTRRGGIAHCLATRKRAVGDEVQICFHRVARTAHAAGDDSVFRRVAGTLLRRPICGRQAENAAWDTRRRETHERHDRRCADHRQGRGGRPAVRAEAGGSARFVP